MSGDRPRLTEREQQTLRGAALGKTNAEIAAELWLSVETIRTHAKSVVRKLGARDRPHAVHLGHVHGYLTMEGS
ncbi:helix-turn-helix domain-containing protein [Amycolatopsis sp. A1MSW2902]|uniref:helix-turn-helix domain-containing protein n=1 Tax=Amycolatopsis sp. A1MSW2902 TaxID=687413 RepID=UPI00307D6CBA